MIRSFLLTASLTLCWALSPDVLVFSGNGFGQHGKTFGLALLAGAALSALAASIIQRPAPGGEGRLNRRVTDALIFPAVTLNLAGRLSPPLLFSTGLLVTAGFTFNETYVFWFPNFGFSFLLLLLIVVLHLCGERMVLAAQQVFFVLTAFCLLVLALAGLMTEPTLARHAEPVPAGTRSGFLVLVPLAMLFFLGYDQNAPGDSGDHRHFPVAVGLGFLLLTLWGLASLHHVPQARLAETSVPYVVGAKAILGQPGRLIMGIAVISGVCGAVNGLFYLAVRTVQRIIPDVTACNPLVLSWLPKIQAIIMALLIALFLALGLAGSENLEAYIFGALLLWLLSIGADCLAAAAQQQQERKNYSSLGYVMGGLILAAVAYLALTYPQSRLVLGFCVSILAASAFFSAFWCRLRRKRHHINNMKETI